MKILFLDIDGVICSIRSATAFGGYPWGVNPEDMRLFDPVAIALLKKLCNETGCKIVLASTWRMTIGHAEIAKILELPIIDSTPYLLNNRWRGAEIAAWLKEHKEDVEKYAIVDDDDDMNKEQIPFLVHIKGHDGILMEHYSNLKKLLS